MVVAANFVPRRSTASISCQQTSPSRPVAEIRAERAGMPASTPRPTDRAPSFEVARNGWGIGIAPEVLSPRCGRRAPSLERPVRESRERWTSALRPAATPWPTKKLRLTKPSPIRGRTQPSHGTRVKRCCREKARVSRSETLGDHQQVRLVPGSTPRAAVKVL